MENRETLDDHERRMEALKGARKKLEADILIMTYLEAKHNNNAKSQDEPTDE